MKNLNSISKFINFSLFSFFIFSVSTLSAYSQQILKMNADSTKVKSQDAIDKMGQMSNDKDLAHPFFSHMGMPHEVGTYSLRLSALATRIDFDPMFNNGKGAFWLSETKEIKNPYMGKAMLTSGSVIEEIK